MTSSSPHFLSMIGKRLLAILLVVIFTCVIITVALQPNGASAQAAGGIASATTTPAVGIDLMKGKPISPTATSTSGGAKQTPGSNTAPQPTPTPYANLRAPLMAKASTNGPEGGTPLTSTRGYSNLNVSLYNAAHLSNFLATKVVSTPIDFHLECWNEASPYSGCKMDNSFSSGNAYSARWQGNVIVPITGTYIFQLADVDDGARFYLDGAFVLDKGWNFPSADTHPGPYTTTLSAGLHNITVDYENRQVWVASLEVRWSGPDFAEEIIPMANRVPECDCTCHPNGCENKVGGPINTRTGNYDYAQQDIALPALGEPLQFKRTYNSLKVGTPALGYGWTDNYNLRLATAPGGLTFQSCGGQQFSFSANTSSGVAAYLGTSGAGGIFTRTQTQPYFYYLTTVNNERYTFNSAGWLIESADAQGHTTALTYDGNRLARVADVTGERYLEFTYDPQGRLIQISDPLGRTIGYGYDTAGDLTVMTDTLGQPWAYTYDGSHRLTEVRNPLNEITEHTEYDSQGRAVRQWQGDRLVVELQYLDTVDALGLSAQTTIITDAAGGVTTDYYSSRGALVQQTNALASTSKAYDANYNPTGSTDPNGHATSFLYNSQGRPLVITDALGNDTHLQYDTQNHLTRLTDAAGASSYYTYTGRLLTAQSDALGLTTIYTYNPQNLLIAQHDPQGRVTEYEYNPWGQRTVVTTTEGVTYYEYDPVGRLITTTDAFNRVTVNAYDNADRLLVVTRNYLAEQPQNYQHAYNLVTSYEYDLAGRQIAITDTLSRVNRNVYDGNGQLIKTIVNADAEREQNELNLYNVTTEYGYDAAGHQVAVTDTLGHVSRTDYDPQSRPVTVTTNYVDGVYESAYPDEDIIRLTEYDPVGNALAQIDPLGRVTRTWHDEVNRVISTTTNYDPNRPQNDWGEYNLITTYGYDQTGNRILITDTLGRVTRNFYDATGRLISTTANTLPGYEQNYLNQYNLNTFYGYDATGRQVLVTNTLGWANRTAYDLVTGRPLTTTANFVDGVFDPAVPDEDIAQSTEYDAHGNPYLRRDAAGRATRMWYDELNRVISVTANYQPDRPQNDEGQYNLVTTYGYDELDNRAWVTDTLGHVTWTQYDALNRAVTVTQNYLTGEPDNYLGQYNLVTTYEYDALGRQGRMQDTRGNATETEYDGLGRTLAQIDPLEQRTEYAYDVLGNRTVLTDAANHVTRFEYDTFNRLITTTRYLDAEPIVEVTHYDAAGNRSETIDARGQAMTYGYDALGRTIAITDANLHVTTFAYDALGRRTAHTDALQHTTVYTPDRLGRQIALADPLGNTTWYGYDVSGNRIVMTDANQIVTRYEYDTLDRLSAVIENDTGGAQINDRDVRTTYAYDALGNRTVMTNAREYPTAYEYDALNRLSRMQDARGKTTEYAYDAVGNRTVMTDANGKVTLFAYDDLNRTSRVDYLDDDTSVEYTYDAIGNRTAMTDTIGTTQYVFDDLNRLTSVTDPLAQTVGYAYDAAGNRTHVIYPDGKVVTTTYDAAGLLTGVIDWDGQTTMYEYDTANRLVTVTLPNTVQTVYTYDEANRLIHLSHTRLSDDVLLADYEFTLDKMGNRVQVIEAMEYPGDSQAAALPPTMADAIVEAITGHRAPGLSAPVMTGTLTSLLPAPRVRVSADSEPQTWAVQTSEVWETSEVSRELPSHRTAPTQWVPVWQAAVGGEATSTEISEIASGAARPRNDVALAPLAAEGDPSEIAADPNANEEAAHVAYNSADQEYLVVWRAYTDQFDVYARRVASDGTPLDSPIAIATDSGNQYAARVAYGAGVYLVTWYDENNASIQAQLVQASGTLSGTAFTISGGSSNNTPAIDYHPTTNEFLIAWVYDNEGDSDIHARRVSPDGQLLDDEISVTEWGGHDLQPAVSHDAAGDYLVLFLCPDSSDFGLCGQRLSDTGSLLGTVFSVFDGDSSNSGQPDLAYHPIRESYLVTWREAAGGASDEIWVREVSSDGTTLGTAQVVEAQTGDPFGPAVAYQADDATYLVVWSDQRAANWDVYGRTVAGDGTPLETPFTLEATSADQTWATVSRQGAGDELLVAYTDNRNGSADILGERFSTSGVNGAFLVAESWGSTYPAVAYRTAHNEALVVWQDYNKINGQRVSSEGQLLGSTIEITQAWGTAFAEPRVAYDPEQDQYLVVWLTNNGDSLIEGRLIAGDGTPGEVLTFSDPAAYYNSNPTLAYNSIAQAFLVTWYSSFDETSGMWGQVVADGALSGNAFMLTEDYAENSALTANPVTGEWLAVWTDSYEVSARRVISDGTPTGNTLTIAVRVGSEYFAEVASETNAAGEYLVIWHLADNGDHDIRGQRLTAQGTLEGNALEVAKADGDWLENLELVYQATSDDFLAVWQVENAGSYDLHGAYVSAAGTVITTELAVQSGDSDQFAPAIVYDAVTQTYLLAWQDTREPSGIYARRWHLPQAEFSAAPLSGPLPLTVTFSNQTADRTAAVTYLWDFGDGVTSTLTNPEHTYAERGIYDVTLTASAGSYSHTLHQANYIFVGLPHPTVIDYTYDGLYRLTAADYSTGERFQYAYDPVGNRTTQTATITSPQVTNYVYDEANRLITVNDQEYTWDDNGNLISDGVTDYTYSQTNRLTTIEDGSSSVTFAYNGDGVRLQQETSSDVIQYTQDLAAPLPVVLQSQAGESMTQYVYALGTRPLAQSSGTWEYLLADALGSVRQIVDLDGNVMLAESYEPYGTVLTSNGTASSIFGYAGEEADTSELVYLRARYMQPTLGIFLARDPWSGDQMRPRSMNGWNYVEGNPILSTDPSGWGPENPNITEIIRQCKELGFNGVNGIPDPRVSGDLCGMYLYYREIKDPNDPDYGYHHDMLRDYMRSFSWGMTVMAGPVAGEQLRHYLDGNGEPRFLSSEWYLKESGYPRSIGVSQLSGSFNTYAGEATTALAVELRSARLNYSMAPCGQGKVSGEVTLDAQGVYYDRENPPGNLNDVAYALGAHIVKASYYDGVNCLCDKKSYVSFKIDEPYDFNGDREVNIPLRGSKIPFEWLDALADKNKANPLRAHIFRSVVTWVEAIDWEARTITYYHDTAVPTLVGYN